MAISHKGRREKLHDDAKWRRFPAKIQGAITIDGCLLVGSDRRIGFLLLGDRAMDDRRLSYWQSQLLLTWCAPGSSATNNKAADNEGSEHHRTKLVMGRRSKAFTNERPDAAVLDCLFANPATKIARKPSSGDVQYVFDRTDI
jgi:hypothetical protein